MTSENAENAENAENIVELQQALVEAETVVTGLRKKIEERRKGERTNAIAQVRDLIRIHDLSALDLGMIRKDSSKRSAGGFVDKRNKVAPKYRDPNGGKTWTGRGKTPAWLIAQLAAGRSKGEFLILPDIMAGETA